MGIVSIGEVIGSVKGGASEPEQPPAKETAAQQPHALLLEGRTDELTRELRVRAWRQTRLQAD